nr:hypothetical protein [uncultured Brevundimonas sp.]
MTDSSEKEFLHDTPGYRSPVLTGVRSPSLALLALVDDLYARIRTVQQLKRQPKQSDDDAFRASLLAFADAIATPALLRIQPHREVSIAFGDGKYTCSPISSTQLRKIRKEMEKLGFIEVGGALL